MLFAWVKRLSDFYSYSFLPFTFELAEAQVVVQGKVVDEKTGSPVAYANIGIVNKDVGTLSNTDGTFFIRLPAALTPDTLQFSLMGYRKRRIAINTLIANGNSVIRLEESPIQLEAITVFQKHENNKTFELGNDKFNGGVLETDTAFAGKAIALLIDGRVAADVPDLVFPVYLSKVRIRIFKNNLPVLKFRVRVNAVDIHSGIPGNDILRESIVVESAMRKGWLEFDISNEALEISEPFFVTFEQILDSKDRTLIAKGFEKFRLEHPDKIRIDTVDFEGNKVVQQFSGAIALDLPGTFISISNKVSEKFTCYVRETSFGEWKRVKGIVTATVILSNQKQSLESKPKSK